MGAFLTGSSTNTQAVVRYDGLQVGTSQFDIPILLFWGQRRVSYNALWYNNFQSHRVSSKGKGGSSKGGKQYTYTAAVILGLGEGTMDSILNVWANGSTTTTTTLSALGMTFFNGSATQTPWSYVESNYPAQARSYARTAYMAAPNLNLGYSASVPENAFEILRLNGFTDTLTAAGWTNPTTNVNTPGTDCSMADIIPDLLTNVQYGMGFTSADLPSSLAHFRAYQDGQGLYFSPMLSDQETATDIINRWAQFCNTWIYWGGTNFIFVPLGDSSIGSYTPDTTAAYDLGPSDFVGSPPVSVTRKDPADCHNRTVIEFTDRTLGYVTNSAEYKDQTLVDQFGLRDNSSTQADEICNPAVAPVVAQLIGKRLAFIRNTYDFSTSYRYIRLLPGSIVTLTDPNIGISKQRVRITDVEQGEDGKLSFKAEELPNLIGTYFSTNTVTTNIPNVPNQMVSPGNVNTPSVIEPSSAFIAGNTPQIFISASGGENYGGCNAYISFDAGATYTPAGTITGSAPQGVLTANLASHADPDTTDTLAVDLTESLTPPEPVTHADADDLRTLTLISKQPTISGSLHVLDASGEIVSFGSTATTGAYTANLTYLRRGQLGTVPEAHSTGDQFGMIDMSLTQPYTLAIDVPQQYIGQPVHIKLAAFNIFNGPEQDLSTVVEYSYTPTGAGFGSGTNGAPATPSGLTATSGAGQNGITFGANAATDNVTQYTLYAAPGLSQPFSSASVIYQGLSTNFNHSGIGNSGAYTYFVAATNRVGTSGHSSGVNSTSTSGGIGSVTSVGLVAPAEFTVSGSPVTASGNLTFVKNQQFANYVYAGPATGSFPGIPSFRQLVTGDIPSLTSLTVTGLLTAVGFVDATVAASSTNEPLLYFNSVAASGDTDTNEKVLIGSAGVPYMSDNSTVDAYLQYHGTSLNSSAMLMARWATGAGQAPRMAMTHSRGASVGTQTTVVAGDRLGTLAGEGSDGTKFVPGAELRFIADPNGTIATGIVPGQITGMTANAAGTLTQAFSADSKQNFYAYGAMSVNKSAVPGTGLALDVNGPLAVGTYTLGTLPTVPAATVVYCSNLGGGAGYLQYDGSFWKRMGQDGLEGQSTSTGTINLVPLSNGEFQNFNTPLTGNVSVLLSTSGAYVGARFHVTRSANATGASTLSVAGNTTKILSPGTWVEYVFNGTNWLEQSSGSL